MRSRILLLFSLLFLFACRNDQVTGENTGTGAADNHPEVQVPRFDRDTAYQFVVDQLAFGPRVMNSEGHEAMKKWLVQKMKSYGAEVIEQTFTVPAYTGIALNGTNIIAQYNPGLPNRILLAAHWDTRHIADSPLSTEQRDEPILGADDGASGVAVLMEVARQLNANPIEFGIDIIFFDAEDYGFSKEEYASQQEQNESVMSYALGAQHWSRNKHTNERYQYGILLDMVGAKNAYFPKEGYSMEYAGNVVDKIWKLARSMAYSNYFADVQGGGVTDDHFFVNNIARIPMIDIINLPPDSQNRGFANHWHTHNDDIDVIDRRTLRVVGQVMLAVLYREYNGTL
ncbi:MAG: M28 family peptidase [Saprospiraceae bacterium]|nr:M28 family peptidase [Lewinella sp.]